MVILLFRVYPACWIVLANKGQLIPDVIVVAIADKGTQIYSQP
jgi:hypothetical protein